ncbi:hypothetical protein SAMN05660710_02123 [Paracoccus tibetensis]|uniref:Uncharacterized protein n=1 Tax=Paracoccus tibetensis TaxID=336292 RepID=A0A1G5HEG3_9RHOB|nr:hypothetical protein SAMN05660710_02123 [Paracoccus tibetensis]
MTQHAASSLRCSNGHSSRDQYGALSVKNPAHSTDPCASRRWFSDLLWRAFPSRSERELSEKASAVLDVSPRQVINWLREEHDPKLRYVMAVIALAGAEIVFSRIEGHE